MSDGLLGASPPGLLGGDSPLSSALNNYVDWWKRGPLGGMIAGTPPEQREPWDPAALAMGFIGPGSIKAAGALPMDLASRMGRATEQGYTTPVYHGTQAVTDWMSNPQLRAMAAAGQDIPLSEALSTNAITAFKPKTGGLKLMDGLGVHTGTPEAANARLQQYQGTKFGTKGGEQKLENSYILPLLGKTQRPFTKANGDPHTETELQSKLAGIAQKLGFDKSALRSYSSAGATPRGFREAQSAVRNHLIEQGYDSVPYINSHEARGSTSWIFLQPQNVRSRFAAFDPAKTADPNLLAGAAAIPMTNRKEPAK